MPSPTTRLPKHSSAATLIEIMVAAGLFLFVALCTYMIYDLGQRSNRKTELHSETYRQAAVALRHIRRELKGAEVNPACEEHDEDLDALGNKKVCYRVAQWKDDHIVVDHRGEPVYLPERAIYVNADGELMVKDTLDNRRKLADLGGDGEVIFDLVPDTQLLEVTVRVIKDGEFVSDRNHSERELTMTVGLANQAFWRDLTVLTKS